MNMNQKLLILLIIIGLFLNTGLVLAQTTMPGLEQISQEIEEELPRVKVLPGQALYFLKIIKEKIEIFTTFGAPNKARVFLKFAKERLTEYQALRAQRKEKLAERVLEKYIENLEKAIENLKIAQEADSSFEETAERVAESTEKHLRILTALYEKVPEPARQGISRAIEASQRGIKTTQEILSGQHQEQVQERAKEIKGRVERGAKGIFKRLWPVPTK